MTLRPPVSPRILAAVQAELGQRFPPEYEQLVFYANGGVGFHGSLVLYSVEELPALNDSSWRRFYPDRVLFGSDGGMEGYSFDVGSSGPVIREVPFDSVDPDDEVEFASNLPEFFQRARADYSRWES